MGYDFSQINDKEFEILVADLLSEHFDVRIERFKPGRDGGVDGRFFSSNDQEIIIQSKHYIGTGYKGLIHRLKKEEAKKVNKLTPKRYIFATSLPLSRDNKKEIRGIFKPFLKRDDDIFGQEDLNDLLSLNPTIEEKHFKLWITNIAVFERVLNNAVKGRSHSELERIRGNAYKYVHTTNHRKAIDILREKNVLIISGEPGIGKTSLAENLCLLYASRGFEFIDIQESLSEAEDVYKDDNKQVFYFDDFLGRNYFEAIENNKGSHIVKFLDRIKNDNTKKFILTSRTSIFNSGLLHSNAFKYHKLRKQEFLLTIESLSDLDRARILYNHIWYSNLGLDYIEQFYIDKRYKTVIKHKNFNPRLIEFITDIDRISVDKSSEYWGFIGETLKNPEEIWADSFKRQNNEYVRGLVNLTVYSGGDISEIDLKESYGRLIKLESYQNKSHTEKDFKSMSELAVKSFLNRKIVYSSVIYSLFNPSIADFVINEYSENHDKIKSIFQSLSTVKSLQQLKSLEINKLISKNKVFALQVFLLSDALENNKSYDYIIYLSSLLYENRKQKEIIIQFLEKLIDYPETVQEFSRLLDLISYFKREIKIEDYTFLIELIENKYLDESEISDLIEFIETNEIDEQYIVDYLQEELTSYLKSEIVHVKGDVDLNKYIDQDYGYYDEYDEVHVNRKGIEDELRNISWDLIGKFQSATIDMMEFDLDEIIGEVDIDEMIDNFLESQGDTDEGGWTGSISYDQDIDDLFERG